MRCGSKEGLDTSTHSDGIRVTCSNLAVIRMIQKAFESEGFDPAPDDEAPNGSWSWPGQTRGTFDQYTHRIDWSDPTEVKRVLQVFEEILAWGDGEYAGEDKSSTQKAPRT
jgi:hypothetical protein